MNAAALSATQAERLRTRAHQQGAWPDYACYCAAAGIPLAPPPVAARDPLTAFTLALLNGHAPARPTALPPGALPPWLAVQAAHRYLTAGDVDATYALIEHQLAADRADFGLLTYAARWAAAQGATGLARGLCDVSLGLAPDQADIAALREHPAGPAPRLPGARPVAVYVPAYNAAATLAATLEALLTQSHPIARLLVVDDGSTDETRAVAARYPVETVSHEANRGLGAARNTAFATLDAPLVAAFDADVAPEPDYLTEALTALALAPGTCAGVGGRLHERHLDTPADRWRAAHLPQEPGPQRRYPVAFIAGSNTMYKRAAVQEAGGHNPAHRTNAEDVALGRALTAQGHTVVHAPAAHAHHLRRDTTASVLRTFWNWSLAERRAQGHLDSTARAWAHLAEQPREIARVIAADCVAGREDLLALDVLLLFDLIARVLGELHDGQLVEGPTAAAVLSQVLAPLYARDAQAQTSLAPQIAQRLPPPPWGDVPPAPPPADAQPLFDAVARFVERMPAEQYLHVAVETQAL